MQDVPESLFVSAVPDLRQNKSPFAIALGDLSSLQAYFLTSKASPNDSGIVIVVIIIVIGEAKLVVHIDGIIAQTLYLDRGFCFWGVAKVVG